MICLALIIVFAILVLLWIYSFITRGRYHSDIKLTGKTVIVTGGSEGIGKAVATDFVRRDAKVIIAAHDKARGDLAVEEIKEKTGKSNVRFELVDLASQKSIRAFCDRIKKAESRLDVLVNNAGVSGIPKEMTEDGLEKMFAVNYFGPFLLTNLLLDLLKKSAPSRIIITSSAAHYLGKIDLENLRAEKYYDRLNLYGHTKLACVYFAWELSKQLEETRVGVYCLQPGSVHTGLLMSMPQPLKFILYAISHVYFRSPEEGAMTTVYCSVAPELEGQSGNYYAECRQSRESSKARDYAVARKLWELSERYTGLSPSR